MIRNHLFFSLECEYKPKESICTFNIRNLDYENLLNTISSLNRTCLNKITINYTTKNLLKYIVTKSSPEIDLHYTDQILDNLNYLKTLFSTPAESKKFVDLTNKIRQSIKKSQMSDEDWIFLTNEFIQHWLPYVNLPDQISLTGTLIIDFNINPISQFDKIVLNSIKSLIKNIELILNNQIKSKIKQKEVY